MRDQRPRELPGSEILGHGNGEDSPLAARQKVRGLALVGTSRLDAVIRTNGDVELFFQIAIEVADQEAEAAVGSLEPALECAGDALAGVVRGLEGQLSPCE